MIESPINRQAGGFLGFVDVKAMGANPNRLGQMVSGVVHMAPFYIASARRSASGLAPLLNGSQGLIQVPALTVPDNKAWLVENITVFGPGLVAAETLTMAPAIRTNMAFIGWMGEQKTAPASTLFLNGSGIFEGGFYVAPPGYVISVLVQQAVLAGALNANVQVTYLEVDYP